MTEHMQLLVTLATLGGWLALRIPYELCSSYHVMEKLRGSGNPEVEIGDRLSQKSYQVLGSM